MDNVLIVPGCLWLLPQLSLLPGLGVQRPGFSLSHADLGAPTVVPPEGVFDGLRLASFNLCSTPPMPFGVISDLERLPCPWVQNNTAPQDAIRFLQTILAPMECKPCDWVPATSRSAELTMATVGAGCLRS